jgi:hypothetical protein
LCSTCNGEKLWVLEPKAIGPGFIPLKDKGFERLASIEDLDCEGYLLAYFHAIGKKASKGLVEERTLGSHDEISWLVCGTPQ